MVERQGTRGAAKEMGGRKGKRGDSVREEKQTCEKEKVAENHNEREGKGKKNMKADLTRKSLSGYCHGKGSDESGQACGCAAAGDGRVLPQGEPTSPES